MVTSATTEKLGIMDWAIDRDVFSFRNTYIPLSVYRPHLAESWDTPDPLTIIFNIRNGVNWHDKAPMNGREFTADDVVFNFHRLLGLGDFAEAGPSLFTHQRPPGKSVTATDRYTVVIKLPEPSSAALGQYLGIGLTYMNAPEVIQQHGDVKDWRNLVGTGTPCSTPLKPLIPKRNGRNWSKKWICTPWRTTGGYGVRKLESTWHTSRVSSALTVKTGSDLWSVASYPASGLTVS